MMAVAVESSQGQYGVHVGKGLLKKVGRLMKDLAHCQNASAGRKLKVMVVTQPPIGRYYLPVLRSALIRASFEVYEHCLPDGEKAKSEKELFRLYRSMLQRDFERRDMVLALGGGVVGDLAAFAASTYMRGVPFVNVATTLLAQVDSAIGGKTGINLSEGKNLVGTFYPPQLVVSDVGTLMTLPNREFYASLAEVVKYGVISDAGLFRLLEEKKRSILNKSALVLSPVITACAKIKAAVVSRDEKEVTGERMILNYGHTFGHAFEQMLGYEKLMHGEAVSIGMTCAAKLAVYLGMLPKSEEERQGRLLSDLKLPVRLDPFGLKVDGIMKAMLRDKKKMAGDLKFVLPERIGRVVIKGNVPPKVIGQILLDLGAHRS